MRTIKNSTVVGLYVLTMIASLFAVYFVMPLLKSAGLSQLWYYSIAMMIPFTLLIVLAGGLREKGLTFTQAFNIKKMSIADVVCSVAVAIGMFVSTGLLSFTVPLMQKIPFFQPPSFWVVKVPGGSTMFGEPVAGNFVLLIVLFALTLYGTFAEEIFGRGYLLTRQIGKYAWVLNGFMWTLFHVYSRWEYLLLLPGCLLLAYVTQRRNNTSIALLSHLLVQMIPFIIMIPMVVKG